MHPRNRYSGAQHNAAELASLVPELKKHLTAPKGRHGGGLPRINFKVRCAACLPLARIRLAAACDDALAQAFLRQPLLCLARAMAAAGERYGAGGREWKGIEGASPLAKRSTPTRDCQWHCQR